MASVLLFPDRVSGVYSVWVLVIVAVVLAGHQNLGTAKPPITCWTPAPFTQPHVDFAHQACWSNDEYFLRNKNKAYNDAPPNPERNTKLYERLPFLLLAIGALLYIPVGVWQVAQRHPAIPLVSVLSTARHCVTARDHIAYERLCSILARRFGGHLLSIKNNVLVQLLTLCNGYLTLVYAMIRVMSVVVIAMPLIGVSRSLGNISIMEVLHGNVFKHEMEMNQTDRFPRVIMCAFNIRVLGNIHKYSLQCMLDHSVTLGVLTVLKVWLTVLLAVQVVALVQYVISSVFNPCCDVCSGVRASLRSMGVDLEEKQDEQFRQFILTVGWDGVFIMRMVTEVSSSAVASEMMAGAYNLFKQPPNNSTSVGASTSQQHPQQGGVPMGVIQPAHQQCEVPMGPSALPQSQCYPGQPQRAYPKLETERM